jgi:8-oxo-dGTP pyrophosphatase MutT (NUDIX family)
MKLWAALGRVVYWLTWPGLWVYLRFGNERTRVAVICGEQILLTKGWLGTGRWALPGGGLHRGEKPEVGAVREVREETGLELKPEQLKFNSNGWVSRNGLKFRYRLFIVELKQQEKPRRQPGEILVVEWVDHQKLSHSNAGPAVMMAVHAWWG